MSLRNYRLQARQGITFGCRYVQRTLGQIGDDAISLPLVSRHLSECPACRAHRRRIKRVDNALQEILLGETPQFFEGRWETIRTTLSIDDSTRSEKGARGLNRFSGRLITAVIGLIALIGAAWSIDHRNPVGEMPITIAPGISITAASVEGEEATVAVEAEDDDDGTLYMWLGPIIDDQGLREDRE